MSLAPVELDLTGSAEGMALALEGLATDLIARSIAHNIAYKVAHGTGGEDLRVYATRLARAVEPYDELRALRLADLGWHTYLEMQRTKP